MATQRIVCVAPFLLAGECAAVALVSTFDFDLFLPFFSLLSFPLPRPLRGLSLQHARHVHAKRDRRGDKIVAQVFLFEVGFGVRHSAHLWPRVLRPLLRHRAFTSRDASSWATWFSFWEATTRHAQRRHRSGFSSRRTFLTTKVRGCPLHVQDTRGTS